MVVNIEIGSDVEVICFLLGPSGENVIFFVDRKEKELVCSGENADEQNRWKNAIVLLKCKDFEDFFGDIL